MFKLRNKEDIHTDTHEIKGELFFINIINSLHIFYEHLKYICRKIQISCREREKATAVNVNLMISHCRYPCDIGNSLMYLKLTAQKMQ